MSIAVETARDILLSAFETMVVRMDEETLGASDEEVGVRYINWIMSELSENGVDLGFTLLTKISDPVTISKGLMMSLIDLLAHKLWPKYRTGEPIASTILEGARQGRKQMYKSGIEIGVTEYPSTLPRGSGNDYPSVSDNTFYPDYNASIVAENNGSISLEDDTDDE